MQVKGNTNIVQANYLIEHRPKFTKDETRLFLTIIGAINKGDVDFKPLEIPVSEIAELWNMESNAAYRKIKTALRGLVRKEFFLEGVDQETGKIHFISASYLSAAAYEVGAGTAKIEISQAFRPYLLVLKKNYTLYVLENILKLSTVNSIRNYELLKQYEAVGRRIFSVEDYKCMLGIEKKYAQNIDLRLYVIEPAVKEINAHTDIRIYYEMVGRGPKAEIVFTIKPAKSKKEAGAEVAAGNRKTTARYSGKNGSRKGLDADRLAETTRKIQKLIEAGAEPTEEAPSARILGLSNAKVAPATSLAVEEAQRNGYGTEDCSDMLAQFRGLEDVIPKDVCEENPKCISAIYSILKDYVSSGFTPAESLEFMVTTLRRFNKHEWAAKKGNTKRSLSGHYKSCLEYWLPKNVSINSGSSDDWDSGLPEAVLKRGMGD